MGSLCAALPFDWVAAAVKAGDDGHASVGGEVEEKGIGEVAEDGSADVPVDHGELFRGQADPLDADLKRGQEAAAEPRSLVFVPVLCVEDLDAGEWSEDDCVHVGESGAALFKLCFEGCPGDSLSAILIERGEAGVECCLLGGGQGKMILVKAVPELRDEGEALGGRQSREFFRAQPFHEMRIGDGDGKGNREEECIRAGVGFLPQRETVL